MYSYFFLKFKNLKNTNAQFFFIGISNNKFDKMKINSKMYNTYIKNPGIKRKMMYSYKTFSMKCA